MPFRKLGGIFHRGSCKISFHAHVPCKLLSFKWDLEGRKCFCLINNDTIYICLYAFQNNGTHWSKQTDGNTKYNSKCNSNTHWMLNKTFWLLTWTLTTMVGLFSVNMLSKWPYMMEWLFEGAYRPMWTKVQVIWWFWAPSSVKTEDNFYPGNQFFKS